MNSAIRDNALNISHNYCNYLMSLENVEGVGFGNKYINGVDTLEPCIHVLVSDKINNQYITKNNLIPKFFMGIKTDVIEIGIVKFRSKDVLIEKIRPLEGGYSVECEGLFGTLGCIVTKIVNDKKQYFILSNNHVIADANIPSSTEPIPIGSKVIQPAETFGGTDLDVVAFLSSYIPIKLETSPMKPVNYVDCAIARVKNKQLVSSLIALIGPLKGIGKAEINLKVRKSGMTTGRTEGKIITIGATKRVHLDDNSSAIFKNQIIAELYNDEGDSGSVVLNENNEVIGLLFAGTSQDVAIINDINTVLNALKVELFTEE